MFSCYIHRNQFACFFCVCVEHLKRCKTSTLIDGIAFSYQVLCHYNEPVLRILPGVYPISFSIAGGVTVDFLVTPTKLWKSTGWKFGRKLLHTCSVAPGRIQVAAGGHVILCFLLLFNCTVKYQPNFNLRFLTSDHSMAPVRFNWSVFARKMHSTSEFAKMFLSKCVIHAGFVKVAWTPRGKPCQAKNWHVETTPELTLLN